MIFIVIVPVIFLVMLALAGGSLLVNFVNNAEMWIQRHFWLVCLIVLFLYALIVIIESRSIKRNYENHNISLSIFVLCSSIRAVASALYVIFLIGGIAVTFEESYSIFENLLEVLGLIIMIIPIFAFQIFEGVFDLETSNSGAVIGCILSSLASIIGMVIFEREVIPQVIRYMF